MQTSRRVAVIVGSLRKGSYNRLMAWALAKMAGPTLEFDLIEIGNLPLYNEDVEAAGAPETWSAFRQKIQSCQAVLFVTPEYNRSVPAALKNALDVGSRPYGQSVWNGKPGAVISVSPGAIGGFGANHHLRQSLVFLNVPAMQQPEAYIGSAASLFNEAGDLVNDSTRTFLEGFLKAFSAWIEALDTSTAK